MKVILLFLVFSSLVLAQDAATPTPTPAVSPSPEPAVDQQIPTADPSGPTQEPTPAPETTPAPPVSVSNLLDSLSIADLQEALTLLKANYIHPDELSEESLARALMQGIVERLGPGVDLLPAPAAASQAVAAHPFLAEMLDERIGYVRLGELSAENVNQLDSSLDQFNSKGLKSVVLDLRATPPSNNLDRAVEVIKRFVPKGRVLFTVRKPSEKQERIFTSDQDPRFQGLTMLLVDGDTAGAAEIIAAGIRAGTKAMVLGEQTAGRAVEYEDRQLRGGRVLRMAVAEVVVADSKPIFPDGIKPELIVQLAPEERDEIFQHSREKGVSQFVFDKERPRMNEAALIAGTFPELDAFQAEQAGDPSTPGLRDVVLQRAVDLITTISIYESR